MEALTWPQIIAVLSINATLIGVLFKFVQLWAKSRFSRMDEDIAKLERGHEHLRRDVAAHDVELAIHAEKHLTADQIMADVKSLFEKIDRKLDGVSKRNTA